MKAGTEDPETTSTARQRHDTTVTNNQATEELLDAVFYMRYVPRLYKENQMKSIHHKSHIT
jgi:hypothetical protein